jgi:D-cysteine desulfhydrase
MQIQYPDRLSLACLPTPLLPLRRISREIGGPLIWVKRDDLTGSTVSGNKVRKLEFALAAALDQGCDTIITVGGVQSNHCRATALLCAQLGLHCHLLLFGPDQPADGNLLLDKLAGARISFYPPQEDQASEDEALEDWRQHHVERGRRPYTIPAGASDGVGLWGYIAAAQELSEDFRRHAINPGHIVTATGSGGTQGGLVIGKQLFGLDSVIWGINIKSERYFLDKIRSDMRDWKERYQQSLNVESLDVNVIDGYVGSGYAIASAEVFAVIRQLARMEGLVLDPVYTGKAFYGMIDKIKLGLFDDASDIVFLHTGGIFGLFPQRAQLLEIEP